MKERNRVGLSTSLLTDLLSWQRSSYPPPLYFLAAVAILLGAAVAALSAAVASQNAWIIAMAGASTLSIGIGAFAVFDAQRQIRAAMHEITRSSVGRFSLVELERMQGLVESGEFERLADDPLSSVLARDAKDSVKALVQWFETKSTEARVEDPVDALLIPALRAARKEVNAVSPLGVGSFWSTAAAENYVRESQLALERGLTTRRVFILESDLEPNSLEILGHHVAAGGEVRVLNASDLPTDLIRDFLIIDDAYAVELSTTPPWEAGRSVRLTMRPDEIDSYRYAFQRIWETSRKVDSLS
jgi:hypothetical protein